MEAMVLASSLIRKFDLDERRAGAPKPVSDPYVLPRSGIRLGRRCPPRHRPLRPRPRRPGALSMKRPDMAAAERRHPHSAAAAFPFSGLAGFQRYAIVSKRAARAS